MTDSIEPVSKPNIVMILVDDADAKVFDYIPRTRKLIADAGATVPDFLISQPVCGPSRASIFRGMYSHNTGVDSNNPAYRNFVRNGGEDSNIAQWLHEGYTTALIGKYLNGYPAELDRPKTYIPPGWDEWFALFRDAGDAYDYDVNDNGKIVHYGHNPRTDYVTNVLTDRAVKFINEVDRSRPFLLWLTPKAPHYPAIPAEQYADAFGDVTYPKGKDNPSFDEADVSDKPPYLQEKLLDGKDIAAIDENFRQRIRSMQSIEDMVDAVVTALGDRINNTYIFFATDNGYHSGEHRLGHGKLNGGKNTAFEEDIRCPMFVRGPGIKAGSTIDGLIGNIDLAPTMCDIAGVKPDAAIDGRSFLPLARGEDVEWRYRFLISRGEKTPFNAVRATDHIYISYRNSSKAGAPGEYYDLVQDPYELANVYDDLGADRLKVLQERVGALVNCSGDSCRVADR